MFKNKISNIKQEQMKINKLTHHPTTLVFLTVQSFFLNNYQILVIFIKKSHAEDAKKLI